MKKLILILSLAISFLFVGCQKEDIRPNTSEETFSSDRDNNSDCTNKSLNSPTITTTGSGDDDNGIGTKPITDPNHDEDEDDRIKK